MLRVMLGPFITTYVLGVLVGRHGVTVAPLWPLAPLVLLLFANARVRCVAALLCGFLWGASHAGRTHGPNAAGRILRVNVADGARGSVLVDAGGRVFEASGPDLPGQTVRLTQAVHATVLSSSLRAISQGGPGAAAASSMLSRVGRFLAERWKRSAASQAPPVAALLKSITVGDGSGLDASVHEDFKATGLYHLLVVSGQHVTMLGLCAATLLAVPFRVAYALRVLSARHWRHVDGGLGIAGIGVAVVYAFATGLNAATQRAVVMFAAWQLLRLFFGEVPPLRRLGLCLGAQILLFPIGLLSEAALMSWSAYLLVGAAEREDPLKAALWMQTKLSIIAAAAFGQLAVAGIVLNLILVPVFTVAMLAAAALVAVPDIPGGAVLSGFLLAFQQAVAILAGFSRQYGYVTLSGTPFLVALRGAFFVASAIFVLNTLHRLTIRRYVDG